MNEINACQDRRDLLNKEIQSLRQQIVDTDDTESEKGFQDMLCSKELELKKVMVKLYQLKDEFKKKRLKNIQNNRRKNTVFSQKKDIMTKARKDAYDTAFKAVAVEPEEIALLFSTDQNIIEYVPGRLVRPTKFAYKWFHDVSTRDKNIIPLSPGICIPQKYSEKHKKVIPIHFYFSYFFNDDEFIKQCSEYYHSYGIDFTLKKDICPKKQRYWIELKLKQEGYIYF